MALKDIYLSGNPQITFFKMIYRRHTNFSREYIEQIINGDIGIENKITAIISKMVICYIVCIWI